MRHFYSLIAGVSVMLCPVTKAKAQLKEDVPAPPADTVTVVLSLDDALRIALSENITVKVADMEITRSGYAKKGTYAALFPQINGTGSYQRTIKKQIMYMGGDDSGSSGGGGGMASMFTSVMEPVNYYIQEIIKGTGLVIPPYTPPTTDETTTTSAEGIAVGRWNTWNGGITASMPIINAQLWESIKLAGQNCDLAVEKARSSRMEMISQVKQAYYGVLMAKEAFSVYKSVYENAVENFAQTERRYNVQRASELEYARAKANVANAIPNVYNAESSVILSLLQLKAVMGLDLEKNIDTAGSLQDYASQMAWDINEGEHATLDYNSTTRQLEIQAEQLATTVRMQQFAYLPTLSLSFSYSMNAMTNDFKFSQYKWTPYSFVGVSLNIPIFSGFKRLNDVRQAKVQRDELDLQRINTERQLKISIRQFLNTMETGMKSYASAREAVEMAQKAYDISEKSYNVGKSTLTDLNDAQLVLTQSRLAENQAIYNFLVAKTGLEQLIGRDFLDEEGKVELDKR
ncbi:MAG: TolC family protein [Bacteroidales bacterium]|nr:TolC family protein [Bacteroidales bacterium]